MIENIQLCRIGRLCLGVMSGLLVGLCLAPAGRLSRTSRRNCGSRCRRDRALKCASSSRRRDCSGPVCLPVPSRPRRRCPSLWRWTFRPGWFSPSAARFRGCAGGAGGARRQSESGSAASPASRGKAVRWVAQAAAAINGEVRPTASVLRPGLSLLVAQRDAAKGAVVVVSPAGPMTRSELELVQGLGDPLTLADFLPREPVAKGRSWKLPESAVVCSHRV